MFMPTDHQKRLVFHYLFYEIVYTFGVPRHNARDYSQWEVVNFTRMAHARILYEFFQKREENGQNHDVLAEDFGYRAEPNAYDPLYQGRLDLDLLNLSYDRLRHMLKSKPVADSILGELLKPVLGFMRHIRDQPDHSFLTSEDKSGWSLLIELLESGRELTMRVLVNDQGIPAYHFALGRSLPNGKPALSEYIPVQLPTIVPGKPSNKK